MKASSTDRNHCRPSQMTKYKMVSVSFVLLAFSSFLFLLVFVHMCSGLGVPQREVRGQVHMPSKLNHQVLQVRDINVNLLISTHRLGICREKTTQFLHILQVYTHLNVNFLHNCQIIYTFCSILIKRGPNY